MVMKRLKRILLILFIVLLSVIPVLYGTVYFFGKNIEKYVVAELNKSLAVEIKVGEIDFSIIRQFPKASLLFTDVIIYENFPGRKKELLHCDEIFLVFNIRDILEKKYIINEIVLNKGTANLYVDSKGRDNYTIVKEDNQSTDSDTLQINLQSIRLNQMNIRYDDRELDFFMNGDIESTVLSGNFKDAIYDLEWKGKAFIEQLTYSKVNYIKQRNITMDAALNVDAENEKYTFSRALLNISGIDFDIKGDFDNNKDNTKINLSINGSQMDIRSFLSLLPESTHEFTKDFKSTGNFYFTSTIKGEISDKHNPHIEVNFGVENGSVYKSGLNEGFEQLNCKGHFTNGNKQNAASSVLTIKPFKASLGGHTTEATFELSDLNDPFIKLSIRGNIDLSKLGDLLDIESIESIKGFAFADASFRGKVKTLQNKESILQAESEGSVKLSNIELKLKNAPDVYEINQGLFKLQGNNFIAENFSGTAGDTKIELNGTLQNFLPYLLLSDQHLHIIANLQSPNLDLEKVFFTDRNEERIDSSGYIFSPAISMNLQLNVDQLKLYKFKASAVSGTFNLNNRVLKADNVNLKTMEGDIVLNGEMNNSVKDKILMVCEADLRQINITELFYQCNNFGQNELTDKHMKGKLNTKIQFASVWNTDFVCDMNKIAASADVSITNGELLNYEPLQALSKYADVNDLRNLKFDKMQNTIQIKDKTILIPQMDIKNNAINLSMSGSHSFDNYVDYRVRVKLSDVMRKKRNKPVNTEFEEEDTESGGLYIYLHVVGPLGNLKISYDKLSVKKKIKESVKTEQKNIKDVFRKEFQTEEDRQLKEEEKKQEEEVNWEEDLPQ